MVRFSVIGTKRKVPRSMQACTACSEFEKETSEIILARKFP